MELQENIGFSRYNASEIERMLRYVDFLMGRDWDDTLDKSNLMETVVASAVLCQYPYTPSQLRSFIEAKEAYNEEIRLLQRYFLILQDVMQGNDDGRLDEMVIMRLFEQLTLSHDIPRSAQKSRIEQLLAAGGRPRQLNGVYANIEINQQLSSLVEWYLIKSDRKELHPILTIGIFVYNFYSLDTLPSHKEEMTHLLTHLLLRQNKAYWVALYSPIRVMLDNRVEYINRLKNGTHQVDGLSRWLVYWVNSIYEAARKAGANIAPVLQEVSPSRKSPINMRQRRILDFITANQPVKLSGIVEHLHKESVNTVKKDLLRLRELGYICSQGKLKGTVYYKI